MKKSASKTGILSSLLFFGFTDFPEQVGGGRTYLHVIDEKERRYRRFGTIGKEYTVQIQTPPKNANALNWLEKAILALYELITNDREQEDYVGVTIASKYFKNGVVWLSFRPVSDLNAEDLWSMIESVVQSNSDFTIDQSLVVTAAFVKIPTGSGRRRLTHQDVRKRSILQIKNNGNDCLPRSLVTALAYVMKGKQLSGKFYDYWTSVRRCNSKKQTSEAKLLVERAGVRIPEQGCGRPEIEKFQSYFSRFNVAIVVYLFQTYASGGNAFFDGVF